LLIENNEGFFQPEVNSPLIAASSDDYPAVPLYPGMDYDNEIMFDLMQASRPESISDRAIGASEFSSTVNVQPYATETNTGPSYLFDNLVNYLTANASQLYIRDEGETRSIMISSNIDWTIMNSSDWITTDLAIGSGDAPLIITFDANDTNVSRAGTMTIAGNGELVTIQVFQDPGELVSVLDKVESELRLFPNPTNGEIRLSNLPSGSRSSQVELIHLNGRRIFLKEYQIVNNELAIDLENLVSGTYLLNIKLMSQNEIVRSKFTRKIVKN